MVSNIQGGILPVAPYIFTCAVVGVLDSNTISFSMKVKEFILNLSNMFSFG